MIVGEKKKREKPEDFIGWKSPDRKLEVIGIAGKQGKVITFKVICTECSKDPELFPDRNFVSQKGHLVNGTKPCGCAKAPKWKDWQFLILARRAGEKKGFIVHGFAEEFHGKNTKLLLECLKDEHKWTANIDSIVNAGRGCPKCAGNAKLTKQEALQKCIDICKEIDYYVIGFVDGYKNNISHFEYICKIHGKQKVSYNSFVSGRTRCSGCAKDENIRRLREGGSGNGYYPERKDEVDFLYSLNFNDKFIKVGRSFAIDERIKSLRTLSKVPKKKIHKLRIFTATHQEIYDLEQDLHNELRERNFQHYVNWSTECFENDSLFILNKLLDACGLEEVNL